MSELFDRDRVIGVRWCSLVFVGVRWCSLVFVGVRWCSGTSHKKSICFFLK